MIKYKKIGFSGAHRTGKTTTVQHLAQTINYDVYNFNTSGIFEKIYFSPSDYFTFAERIKIQKVIKSVMLNGLYDYGRKGDKETYIADRTPLDVAAYLLANIDNTCSSIFDKSADDLISNCLSATRFFFDFIVIIPPSIEFVTEDGKNNKTYNSTGYRLALHYATLGLLTETNIPFVVLDNRCLEVKDRVDCILSHIT